MIPEELVDLRQQMYHAHVAYLRALATLDAVRVSGKRLELVQRAGEVCQMTGRELDAALTTLIHYLEPVQLDAPWAAELHRTQKLKETVCRELALLDQEQHHTPG